MYKNFLNLRNVAAIVACSVYFFSTACGKDSNANPDLSNPAAGDEYLTVKFGGKEYSNWEIDPNHLQVSGNYLMLNSLDKNNHNLIFSLGISDDVIVVGDTKTYNSELSVFAFNENITITTPYAGYSNDKWITKTDPETGQCYPDEQEHVPVTLTIKRVGAPLSSAGPMTKYLYEGSFTTSVCRHYAPFNCSATPDEHAISGKFNMIGWETK